MPVINKNRIPWARKIMRMAFDEDKEPGSFYDAYIANIAMLIYDETNLDIKICNDLAHKLLRKIFY